jgi:hypothetical protein
MARLRIATLGWASALLVGSVLASPAAAQRPPVRPVESLPAFVARYQAAVAAIQAGNCAEYARLNIRGGIGLLCTEEARRDLANFRVFGYRQFGTAAIVDIQATEVRTKRPVVATLVLLLGADRRFFSHGGAVFGAGGGIRQVNTTPTARAVVLSQRTASLLLLSLRERDCDLFFQTAFTGELTKAQACARVFSPRSRVPSRARQLRLDLGGNPLARPVRIGGSRDIQFYRLALKRHLYTLAVDRGGKPGNLYLTQFRRIY